MCENLNILSLQGDGECSRDSLDSSGNKEKVTNNSSGTQSDGDSNDSGGVVLPPNEDTNDSIATSGGPSEDTNDSLICATTSQLVNGSSASVKISFTYIDTGDDSNSATNESLSNEVVNNCSSHNIKKSCELDCLDEPVAKKAKVEE